MKIEVFHNISREASFGLNSVLRSTDDRLPGYALPALDGTVQDERHPLVKVYEFEADPADLDDFWARFNNGSGHEDPAYFARRLRSLSVGDVIRIEGEGAHAVENIGFNWAHRDELRIVTGAEAERLIRERLHLGDDEEMVCTVPL